MPVSRSETPTHAGAMIRHHRRRQGITLVEVAQVMAVSAATVSRWERGRETIPFPRREALAEMLRIDPTRLLEPGPVDLPAEDRRWLECIHSLPASEQAALRELVGMRSFTGERASC
nr:helix-turn-helix transcriptional regulator [Methylobacterium sp. Leaf122]